MRWRPGAGRSAEKLNLTRLKEAAAEAHKWNFRPDNDLLRDLAEGRLAELVERFIHAPEDPGRLTRLEAFLRFIESAPLAVSPWSAQNTYFRIGRELAPEMIRRKEEGDPAAGRWLGHFARVGRLLRVHIPVH